MKKYHNLILKFLTINIFIFLFFIFFIVVSPIKAETQPVKVGFIELDGFFEGNSGEESGYGVEVINKITQYSGLKFQYIRFDSWEEGIQMLKNGEIDMRLPVNLPKTLPEGLEVTEQSIIETYYALLCLNDQNIFFQDYESFKELKIAVTSEVYDNYISKEPLSEKGIDVNNLVFCEEYNECLTRMESGEVDALISNIMDYDDENMKILDCYKSRQNYIQMRSSDERLTLVNDVLSQIKINDPSFFINLYKKYYPERNIIPLNAQEHAYINSLESVNVSFVRTQGYLSDYDEELFGISKGVTEYVLNKLGIDYNPIIIDCVDNNIQGYFKNDVKVIPIFPSDYNWIGDNDISITSSYLTLNFGMIYRKDTNPDFNSSKIAAVKNYYVTEQFILKNIDESQIIWCDDFEQCIDYVSQKKADVTVVNTYVYEYYLGLYKYGNLNVKLLDYTFDISFGVCHDTNGLLTSSINKMLNSMTTEELNLIIRESYSRIPSQDIFEAMIYKDTQLTVAIIIISLGIVSLALYLLIFSLYTKKVNERLKTATEAKTSFMNRVSHDMRTPMNVIIGLTKLSKQSKNIKEIKKNLQKIENESDYLLRLINDTLDVSKIEKNKLEIKLEKTDLETFLKHMVDILISGFDSKQINYQFINDDPDIKNVMIDKVRLQQIITNIISNSIKFTGENGIIDVKAHITNDKKPYITFVISDNGIGMSSEFLNKVFEPFSQENRNSDTLYHGTGLGMNIVKKLVELMGGNINIKSEIDVGTTVTIVIPLILCTDDSSEKLNKKINKFAGQRILVFEDHPISFEILEHVLTSYNLLVEWACDGQKGIDMFTNNPEGYYQAIIMDIRMPVKDGFVTTKEIRGMDRSDAKTIPIIAMTANVFTEEEKKELLPNINGCLSKPIDVKTLIDNLHQIIDK